MEHIDDKMTRLEMYHRVINDIATALGYRTGQTFEPEALVKQVKQLVAILAALRVPSDTMLNAMSVTAEKANVWVNTAPVTSQELQNRLWIAGMKAAIEVAEQEVNDAKP